MPAEIGEQIVHVVLTAAEMSAKLMFSAMQIAVSFLRQRKAVSVNYNRSTAVKPEVQHGEQSLAVLNSQGKRLEHIAITAPELQELRDKLNRFGVDFAVEAAKSKSKGLTEYHIYFKSTDVDRVHTALQSILHFESKRNPQVQNVEPLTPDQEAVASIVLGEQKNAPAFETKPEREKNIAEDLISKISGDSSSAEDFGFEEKSEIKPPTPIKQASEKNSLESLGVSLAAEQSGNSQRATSSQDNVLSSFFQEQQRELTPDALETGETVRTPRGSFSVTAMSREQMEAVGYGLHHESDDGKYLIMGNGTNAFAVAVEQSEKGNSADRQLATKQNIKQEKVLPVEILPPGQSAQKAALFEPKALKQAELTLSSGVQLTKADLDWMQSLTEDWQKNSKYVTVAKEMFGYTDEDVYAMKKYVRENRSYREIPLYNVSFEEARLAHRDQDLLASHQASCVCRDIIAQNLEKCVNQNQTDSFVDRLTEQFGYDRVKQVIAATVQSRPNDKRFSESVRSATAQISLSQSNKVDYVVNAHSSCVDVFCQRLLEREEALRGQSHHSTIPDPHKKPLEKRVQTVMERRGQAKQAAAPYTRSL